jgi:Rap1a immunity proteins
MNTGRAILASIFCVVSTAAFSGFDTGNTLYTQCTGTIQAYCLGYVAGVMDAIANYDLICVPPHVNLEQVQDIVVKYLHEHPESRHYSAASETTLALQQAFPCK